MGIKGGAGSLDRRITFQRLPPATGAKDSFGELTAVPVNDLCNIPAAHEFPGNGNRAGEFWASEKRHSESTSRFRIRFTPRISTQSLPATHRILSDELGVCPAVTREYDIKIAYPIGRMTELIIEVSEIR